MKKFLLLFPLLLTCALPAASKRPNIILIFADDIGYEALNSYGGQDFETPRLTRMAAEGLQFSRAYTSPVCTPSRVSLHTGLYVTRHGHHTVLPVHQGTDRIVDFERMPTFAQLLRAQGYRTSVTGKWQLATIEKHPDHLRRSGFDSWCVWQIWRNGAKTERHWNAVYNHDGAIRNDIAERFGPDVLVDYVIGQMRAATSAGEPFLIVHNELLPHEPIVATPDDHALGRDPSLAHLINYMDKLVGRILDAAESLGIRDHTYIFFMGDNGTYAPDFKNPRAGEAGEGAHTRHTQSGRVNGGKWDLSDAGSHVPLIVWGPPSIPAGAKCDDLVDVVDLFPTFCELTATEIPPGVGIDGRSIVPQIHGRPGAMRTWVHQGLREDLGGESLYDGHFRFSRKSGELIDARQLPVERPADLQNPAAALARARLGLVFDRLSHDGPRPVEPFTPAAAPALLSALARPGAQVVFYGTSLTRSGRWPEVLAKELGSAYPGCGVTNAAENGVASDWGLANLEERVLKRRPDVLFVEFSVNDAASNKAITPAQARSNLEAMLDQLAARWPECVVVLQIMNPVIGRPAGHAGHRPDLPAHEQVYRDVARDRAILMVDHTPGWTTLLAKGEESYRIYVPDGLHPNLAGYEAYMLPTLRRLLGLSRP